MKFTLLDRLVAIVLEGNQRRRLVGLVVLVLGVAFLTMAILSYAVSRERLRDLIVSKELPLTSEIVYAEIQRDFSKPLQASALIASDTFLRDWAIGGEKDMSSIQKFLGEMQRVNSAFTAYFVSDTTHRYYIPNGVLKTVSRADTHDGWFFDLEDSDQPYVVEVDTDQTHDNALTVFINYRVFDYQDHFLGIAGIGLNVDAVRGSLDRYQKQFDLGLYFVDRAGKVMMSGGDRPLFEEIGAAPGLSSIASGILGGQAGALNYAAGGQTHLLNVRYMPELNWYLFVERIEEAAMSNLRKTLYINLAIAAMATLMVAAVLGAAVTRFRGAVEKAVSTDPLTDLTNRRAFNILFRQAARSNRRANRRISLALFDIDDLQTVNANHGHLAGDQTIKAVAAVVEAHSRPNDIVCRWGGEEILLLLQDCGLDKAMGIADGIRNEIERLTIAATGATVAVTVSAGVAEMADGEGEDSALARADEGLRAAKRAGHNRIISTNRF